MANCKPSGLTHQHLPKPWSKWFRRCSWRNHFSQHLSLWKQQLDGNSVWALCRFGAFWYFNIFLFVGNEQLQIAFSDLVIPSHTCCQGRHSYSPATTLRGTPMVRAARSQLGWCAALPAGMRQIENPPWIPTIPAIRMDGGLALSYGAWSCEKIKDQI